MVTMRGWVRWPGSCPESQAEALYAAMATSRFLVLSLTVLAPLSVGLMACGPSINQAAKTDIDRQVGALQASGKSFKPPVGFDPMPLAVGQWVQYKSIDEDGKPSITTHKIVGQKGDAYWFETTSKTYYGENSTAFLMRMGDRRNPETIDVMDIWIRNPDGTEMQYPPGLVNLMMKSMFGGSMSMLSVNWDNKPQEDVSVTAGSFSRCYKARATASILGVSATTDTWGHSSVPISGTVKSLGVDRKLSMDLIDFGERGARSVFSKL